MSETLTDIFGQLSSPPAPAGHWVPHPYQLAIAERLLSGRRVVLRAPTGGGKTLAAWLPWLASRLQPYDFPPTLLHALPGGAFTSTLLQQLRQRCQSLGAARVGLQHEGDAFDPFLLSDAVITSADQLLSVALHRPLGLHPGLSNINAGALLGAYLVFDEFPALARRHGLIAWLGLLRQYLPVAPVLFATAAWPRALCEQVAALLDADFIEATGVDSGGRRQWRHTRALTPETILRRHLHRTMVVCNSVRGAQVLYRALQGMLARGHQHTELLLLHPYQLSRDRQPIEARASALFQPGCREHALLITTPGIEATDLSAELLITDPAPPDALLRRAGRCARHTGEHGEVLVGQVSTHEADAGYATPAAETLLKALAGESAVSAADEMAAYDRIWDDTPAARASLALPAPAEVDANARAIMENPRTMPLALFQRVGACLHRMPETVSDPFELERFSLALSSLERGWQQWQASGSPAQWYALLPRWPEGADHPPTWSVMANPADVDAEARLVVLNAEVVSYHPVIGLELTPGTPYESVRVPAQHTNWSPFDQVVQYYEDHAAGVLAAVEKYLPWYRYVLRHLGGRWRLPTVELEQWLRLCVLWHDAGKLTVEWQRAAKRWQAEVMRRPIPRGVLARIDYQKRRDEQYPCPEHTYASGIALYRALTTAFSLRPFLLQGALLAIMLHHGATQKGAPPLAPHPEAWTTLLDLATPVIDDRLLRRLDRVGWTQAPRGFHPLPAVPPVDPDTWMAYSLLARAIRLADRDMALEALSL